MTGRRCWIVAEDLAVIVSSGTPVALPVASFGSGWGPHHRVARFPMTVF